jgi:hypothetical protein
MGSLKKSRGCPSKRGFTVIILYIDKMKSFYLIFSSNFELMINLILDLMKFTLKLKKYQKNLLNMVINMIQVGLHDHWMKMKLSHQYFVDIVKDLQLHGILLQIPIRHGYKWRKIFVFVVIAVNNHFIFSYFTFCFIDRATKLIAAIRQCEIIVRDANRIHHFYKNGQCSCNDYF